MHKSSTCTPVWTFTRTASTWRWPTHRATPKWPMRRPSAKRCNDPTCFVPVKSKEQSRLMVHRARQGFVEQRTATLNRIRGLLAEFGVVLRLTAEAVRNSPTSTVIAPGFAARQHRI
jgi:transposase